MNELHAMLLKNQQAQSPAAFAEQYIVESIWKNKFPPGSILPAERELSELIGVTRTTLREVLQRLARDGWLTIQHGKPTKVNNYWETGGLNILDTLARLDNTGSLALIDHLLDARTSLSTVYLRSAIKRNPDAMKALVARSNHLTDKMEAYAKFDWEFHYEATHIAKNPVYTFILNGFKTLYSRVAEVYFSLPESRRLAKQYFDELTVEVNAERTSELPRIIRKLGYESAEHWRTIKESIIANASGNGTPNPPQQ